VNANRGPATGVLVVDDHPIWRDAVARDLAAAGFEVRASVGEGRQALRIAPGLRCEVAVLDLHLPDLTGPEVIRGLIEACPGVRILVLSASGEQQDVLDAVKAGATGYLLKSASSTELVDAARRTASGDAVFTPGLAGLVLGEYRRLAAGQQPVGEAADAPRLTERETQVLRLVATGLTYRQIAERLTLSHRTVQNHVQNTLTKLQLHNRVELVRYALDNGLGDDERPAGPR
jgi:DNA-binding NarL/FixJ family response regulator